MPSRRVNVTSPIFLIFSNVTERLSPEMDGEALYQKIAPTWPHLASRVVFVPPGVPSGDLDVFSCGAQVPILRKPFNPDALQRLVKQADA